MGRNELLVRRGPDTPREDVASLLRRARAAVRAPAAHHCRRREAG